MTRRHVSFNATGEVRRTAMRVDPDEIIKIKRADSPHRPDAGVGAIEPSEPTSLADDDLALERWRRLGA